MEQRRWFSAGIIGMLLALVFVVSGCGGSGGGGGNDPAPAASDSATSTSTSSNPTTTTTPTSNPTSTTTPPPAPTVHAPVISALTYSPRTVNQNQGGGAVTGYGSLQFIDNGKDLKSLTIKSYNGSTLVNTINFPISNVSGLESGTVDFTAIADSSAVGTINFEVAAFDVVGNHSNTLTTSYSVSAPPSDPNYDNTFLLRGKWHFVYTIISTWTDDYSLSTMSTSTNSEGGYFIYGTNQYGSSVIASYWPISGNYSLLDDNYTTFEQFYTFRTDGVNILSGCYYQITKSTNAWSQCFALSGSKISSTPAPAFSARSIQDTVDSAAKLLENGSFVSPEMSEYSRYLQIKNR